MKLVNDNRSIGDAECVQGYCTHASLYIDKGFSVIPEKRGMKSPCIKAWTDFAHKLPTESEVSSFCRNFPDAGISVLTGKISGIVALDIDEVRPEILKLIMPLLPASPCVKKGAKGETRFFRFNHEGSDNLKFNGEMVIEVLSTGKKTHIPPSLHPSGVNYKWTGEQELLDVDVNTLPILPPTLLSHLGSLLRLTFPELVTTGSKHISGRNDSLSSLCGKLINEGLPVDEALKKLISFDRENNKPPLLTYP